MDVQRTLERAKGSKKANLAFLNAQRKRKSGDVDAEVHRLHNEVFAEVDCLQCGNCCATTSPLFVQEDMDRIARHLRMSTGQFIQHYLHMDEDGDFVLNNAPCPFLGTDNYCSIYEVRPKACREYPHTNRKQFRQIIDLSLKNAEICPAVATILERWRNAE